MKIAIFFCCILVGCSSWMFDGTDDDDFSAADLEPRGDEDRWWWAPSRKAPLYSRKYQPLLRSLSSPKQGEELRLPKNFVPITYNVILTPIIEPGNFTTLGSVAIDVECVTAINQIVLNSAELQINEPSIRVSDPCCTLNTKTKVEGAKTTENGFVSGVGYDGKSLP